MKCFLSTSCFRGEKLNEAIEKCGELSHRNVEISAPHPYETLSDLKNIFHEFVQNDYKFVFHNYFFPIIHPITSSLDVFDNSDSAKFVP